MKEDMKEDMKEEERQLRRALYERVCDSYHSVDDFRMKLLGLLPVATGTGVFLLLSGKAEFLGENNEGVQRVFGAIGAFGFLFTLGLFCYELFGIKKCHYLIETGRRLEDDLGIQGQFQSRPLDVAGFVNEPFASSVVYPASLAAWLFLALFFTVGGWAALYASAVLLPGWAGTFFGAKKIKVNQEQDDHVLEVLRTRGGATVAELQGVTDLEKVRVDWAVRRLIRRDAVEEREGRLQLPHRRPTVRY